MRAHTAQTGRNPRGRRAGLPSVRLTLAGSSRHSRSFRGRPEEGAAHSPRNETCGAFPMSAFNYRMPKALCATPDSGTKQLQPAFGVIAAVGVKEPVRGAAPHSRLAAHWTESPVRHGGVVVAPERLTCAAHVCDEEWRAGNSTARMASIR
jgi:hypothetical protein